jgi:uncharacterized membrane protein
MEELRLVIAPYYLQVKFIHLLMVAMWTFSTAVAYRDYVFPAFKAWEKDPENPTRIAIRDDFLRRFDHGAQLEHFAFPVLIVTGFMMVWIAGWPLTELSWLTVKLGIVLIVFIPVEVIDYYISHFGGNKEKILATGDMDRHEAMTRFHWRFFKVTTPLVVTLIPMIYYLAVTKPL